MLSSTWRWSLLLWYQTIGKIAISLLLILYSLFFMMMISCLAKSKTISFRVTIIASVILFLCRWLSMSLSLLLLYHLIIYKWQFISTIISSRLMMCHYWVGLLCRNLAMMLILLLNCFPLLLGISCMILSSFSILCGIFILSRIISSCLCPHHRRMICQSKRLMKVHLGPVPSLCTIFYHKKLPHHQLYILSFRNILSLVFLTF